MHIKRDAVSIDARSAAIGMGYAGGKQAAPCKPRSAGSHVLYMGGYAHNINRRFTVAVGRFASACRVGRPPRGHHDGACTGGQRKTDAGYLQHSPSAAPLVLVRAEGKPAAPCKPLTNSLARSTGSHVLYKTTLNAY